jgi:hypothetical protein
LNFTLFAFEQRSPSRSSRVIKQNYMLNWTTWFLRPAPNARALTRVVPDEPAPAHACGAYQPLYKYLQDRYATTVVLRLSEIEDILGFALPASARTDRTWWTAADPNTPAGAYGDAWTSARRTAVPRFLAGTVVFERSA